MSEQLSDQVTASQEDLVYKCRTFLKELSSIECLYFNALLEETGLNTLPMSEYLYDYIFNSGKEEDFATYLKKMNR